MEFDNSLNTSRNILHSSIDRYINHPSILKMKLEVSSKSCSDSDFSRNILVTSDEVEKMLKSLNSKKAAGTDRLPIKLVKLASEVLSKPLSIAMNNSITSSTFPVKAKVATVVPIDKKTDNKYNVSNFRPVSLLNCFSKIYENYIKSHIVNSMNNYISPYVSAYRKGYNSQHVLIRLLEEWRHLDNNKVVGGVLRTYQRVLLKPPTADPPTNRLTDHLPLTHRPTNHLPTDPPTGYHQLTLK